MLISIHQPAYLPWLGYFDKLRQADVFVYLDTVQFQKNSFQNRNKIRTAQAPAWLTIPVETKGSPNGLRLDGLKVSNSTPWMRKHRTAIEMNYRSTSEFEQIYGQIEQFYHAPVELLADYCFEMLKVFAEILEIETTIVRSSELPVMAGSKTDLLLNICQELGADAYLSGSLGTQYLEVEKFEQSDIGVQFQNYEHPEYKQAYPGFEPNMGVIDLLFNEREPQTLL